MPHMFPLLPSASKKRARRVRERALENHNAFLAKRNLLASHQCASVPRRTGVVRYHFGLLPIESQLRLEPGNDRKVANSWAGRSRDVGRYVET